MLGPPLPRSQENQHGFPCYLSHFATVRVQERGFSLHELLMPSLICFTHSYVFQILIITVFMLITSTALGARIHTHIHQLPSLKKKKKVTPKSLGHFAALVSAGQVHTRRLRGATQCQSCPRLPGDAPRARPDPASSPLPCRSAGSQCPQGTHRDSLPWLPRRDLPTDAPTAALKPDMQGRGGPDSQGMQVHNSPHSPSVKQPRQDVPFAGTESSDGSYRLKLPVNIYHAFAKALGAQPNFNHQIDIVAE